MRTRHSAPLPDLGAFTVEDFALYTSLGRATAYHLLKTGIVPSFKVGKARRIRRIAADAFLTKLETGELEVAACRPFKGTQ